MQGVMKELITDLALHYSLSEKQVRFLSDSTFFDSFFEPKSFDMNEQRSSDPIHTPFKYAKPGSQFSVAAGSEQSLLREEDVGRFTPNQSVLSMEELSGLMRNGSFLSVMENSEEVFLDLCSQERNRYLKV